jgi:hypothetical protein
VPFGLNGERKTRTDRFAVQQNRARATDAMFAADMRTRQRKFVADEITEEETRLDAAPMAHAVYGHLDGNEVQAA